MDAHAPLTVRALVQLALLILAGLSAEVSEATAQQFDPEVGLEQARYALNVRGDADEAILAYRTVADNAGDRRDVAALALIGLGEAYEILGRAEARQAYRRVLNEYADQAPAVERARERLAALGPEVRAASFAPADLTMRRLWIADFLGTHMLSPDGNKAAVAGWNIRVHEIDADVTRQVTDLPSPNPIGVYPSSPIWSRNGEWIAYSIWDDEWTHQRLHLVRADGSESRVLVDNEQLGQIEATAFSSGGEFLVARIRGWDRLFRIAVVSVATGDVTILKTEGEHPPHPLSLSPDDRFIAFDQIPAGSKTHDIFVLAVDGSEQFTAVADPADDDLPHWTPDGKRIVFRSDRSGRNALWSVPLEDGLPSGEIELVRENTGSLYPLGFTADGALYYSLPQRQTDVLLLEWDQESGTDSEPRILPDGFIGTNMLPAWSPEGDRIAFVSRRGSAGDQHHLVVKDMASGAETAHALPITSADRMRIDWAAGGDAVYLQTGSRRDFTSYRLSLATGELSKIDRRASAGLLSGLGYALATDRQAAFLSARRLHIAGQNDFALFEEGNPLVGEDETLLAVANGVRRLPVGSTNRDAAEPITPQGHMHAWRLSPDGRTLALAISSDTTVENSDVLYLLSLENFQLRELLRTREDGEAQPVDEAGELDLSREIVTVHWTPDGERLLYALGDGPWDEPTDIWIVAIDGGQPHKLNLELTRAQFADMSISPDGSMIAYTQEERFQELWLMEGLDW